MEQQTSNQRPLRTGVWNQIKQYLFLKKRDPSEPRSVNMFLMHGMNRISILVFLIAVIILIIRAFSRH
jgi:Ni,Fe-hydrogenase I cytochrome b subunit